MAKTKSKSADDVRKSCINFSLSKAEKNMISEKANILGISMSAYIRYKLLYEKNNKEM